MTKQDFKLIYMATADFALPSLQRLVKEGYQIKAVVTMPDKPAGRGMKLRESSIKRYAVEQGIEVLQPEKLKDEAFLSRLRELDPDLGVVVAFRMLPEEVWSLPKYGTINLHGSLLPRYRGAAPINWAIINGDTETGVTTFRLKHEIDTGNILLQASTPISPKENVGDVHDRLMEIGAETLSRTIALFLEGEPESLSQESVGSIPSHAPKLTRENTRIDWHRSAMELHNLVRGLSPYPTAWAELTIPTQGVQVYKVLETEVLSCSPEEQVLPTGTVILRGKKAIDVVTGDGLLRILRLQPQSKRAMTAQELLNGLQALK